MSAPRRLAAALERHRSRTFVGREAVLARAGALLEAPGALFLHGPGGIGKTTLLQRMHARAAERGLPVLHLDARMLPPEPAALRAAVLDGLQRLQDRSDRPEALLLLDTCEQLGAARDWLFQRFVPAELDADVRLLAAGRQPAAGIETLALHYLSDEEAITYLDRRGVPEAARAGLAAAAGGSPLALALAADLHAAGDGPASAAPWPDGDAIAAVAMRLLRDAGNDAQRRALRAAALARVLPQPLLQAMLPDDDAEALNRWLAGLACMEAHADGLLMHDAVRETIAHDLAGSAPTLHEQLCRRAEDYYLARLREPDAPPPYRFVMDLTFLSRLGEISGAYHRLIAEQPLYPDRPAAGEAELAAGWVAHHQGAAERERFETWLASQPDGLVVYREADGRPQGFALFVSVTGLTAEQVRHDPVMAAYRRRLRALGGTGGREAGLVRFWLDREAHIQSSPVQGMVLASLVGHCARQRDIAFYGLIEPDVPATRAMTAMAGHESLADGPERLGDTPCVLTFHDWRDEPVPAWLADCNRRVRGSA